MRRELPQHDVEELENHGDLDSFGHDWQLIYKQIITLNFKFGTPPWI